jgi:hypothetical protein
MPLDRSKIPPVEPPFIARIIDSPMYGRLDGAQWLRGTVPAGSTLTFDGDLDARISQPRFEGKCTFLLSAEAERKMPETANRLKSVLGTHCDVYRKTKDGPVTVSTAAIAPPHNTSADAHAYSSLSNSELKSKVREFSVRLRNFLNTHNREESSLRWLKGA